jgi:mono/diheme cytochrome c family protein
VPTAEEVQAILDINCAGCHVGGGMSGGMGLDDVTLQIGVPSNGAPAVARIQAGDHESSYLWHKISGTQVEVGGGGGQMPLGGVLLQEEIDLIAAWIDAL